MACFPKRVSFGWRDSVLGDWGNVQLPSGGVCAMSTQATWLDAAVAADWLHRILVCARRRSAACLQSSRSNPTRVVQEMLLRFSGPIVCGVAGWCCEPLGEIRLSDGVAGLGLCILPKCRIRHGSGERPATYVPVVAWARRAHRGSAWWMGHQSVPGAGCVRCTARRAWTAPYLSKRHPVPLSRSCSLRVIAVRIPARS